MSSANTTILCGEGHGEGHRRGASNARFSTMRALTEKCCLQQPVLVHSIY